MRKEWSISQVAGMTGVTSRTLRHYGAVGLLPASRVAANGYRYYDQHALVRLQRILLLRELGLGLGDIRDVLDAPGGEIDALARHLDALHAERERIDRQIASVGSTITTLTEGGEVMAEKMFDGFDHTQYKDEVTARWGADAYERASDWWSSLDSEQHTRFHDDTEALSRAWREAAEAGIDPVGADAQVLAERHVAWLAGMPGTPAARGDADATREYVRGLADLYVADDRFAANYGGQAGAAFVRAALRAHVGTADEDAAG